MEGQYMMIMTAKVDLKKIVTIISIIVLMLVAAIWLLDGNGDATAQTSALPAGSNDQRPNGDQLGKPGLGGNQQDHANQGHRGDQDGNDVFHKRSSPFTRCFDSQFRVVS
jgi:hypothetical protein